MGKVVILEGPDGGGKTTLARRLVEEHGFIYKHEGPPPAGVDLMEYYKTSLYTAIKDYRNTVFDRHYLGETVYGPIARGVDRVGREGLKLFERLHDSRDVRQWICLPELGASMRNYSVKTKEKDDYLKNTLKFQDVWQNYLTHLNPVLGDILETDWARYDYERPDMYEDFINRINDQRHILPDGMIGSPTARYLFIGDTANHKTIDLPFFALNGSSGYFNEALRLADLEEKDIAVANAFSPDGKKRYPMDFVSSLLELEKVILLGNKAHEWFGNCFNRASILHPSYMKRFKGPPILMANELRKVTHGRIVNR